MILPYLATALLIVVTIYSAIVSFRQQTEEPAPSWIFPDGAKRSARILVGLTTLALVTGLVARVIVSARNSTQRSLRFMIPEGYTGWVRVDFGVPGEPALPVEGGRMVLKIPPSGLLKTSSPEQFGWARDSYFYYSPNGVRQIPSSQGSLIWGKMNGSELGKSGKRAYEEFFVGSEQQYKEQANGKSGPP